MATYTAEADKEKHCCSRLTLTLSLLLALALAMAAVRADSPVVIDDCDNVATSFPGFAGLCADCGLNIEERAFE